MIKHYEAVTLVLIIIFGGIGWALAAVFGKFGEFIGMFGAVPPIAYYLSFALKE